MQRFASILGGLLLLASTANAATVNTFRVANWTGGAYVNDRTKQFEYCSASFSSPAGVDVAYLVDRQLRWRLTFSNASWRFLEGYAVNTFLRLDERYLVQARSVVGADASVLDVQTEDPVSFFAALWSANRLQVVAGGLRFEIDLVSSTEVLSALALCVVRQTGIARRPNTGLGVRVNQISRDEANAVAKNIQSFSRLAGFELLQSSAQGGVAWKAGPVTGAIEITDPKGVRDLSGVPIRIIETENRNCREGFFFVWAVREVDSSPIARAFTGCPSPEGTTFTYYSAVARQAGGFYILSSKTSGGGFGGVVQGQLREVATKLENAFIPTLDRVQNNVTAEKTSASPDPVRE